MSYFIGLVCSRIEMRELQTPPFVVLCQLGAAVPIVVLCDRYIRVGRSGRIGGVVLIPCPRCDLRAQEVAAFFAFAVHLDTQRVVVGSKDDACRVNLVLDESDGLPIL